jgi:hypothetical protein
MAETDDKLDAIRARHAAASKGPWRWFGYLTSRNVGLHGPGMSSVMEFNRWGRNGAQPAFTVNGLLERLADLVVPDSAPGRGRVTDINHPDARFIAASWEDLRDLLGAVDALQVQVAELEREQERVRRGLRECVDALDCHEEWIPNEVLKLKSERDALRAFALDFATTAEDAVAHHRHPPGGQQVPYTGDFAVLPSHLVETLEKWARAARACLAFKPAATIAPASQRTEWSTATPPHGCPMGMPCDVCEPEASR